MQSILCHHMHFGWNPEDSAEWLALQVHREVEASADPRLLREIIYLSSEDSKGHTVAC